MNGIKVIIVEKRKALMKKAHLKHEEISTQTWLKKKTQGECSVAAETKPVRQTVQ